MYPVYKMEWPLRWATGPFRFISTHSTPPPIEGEEGMLEGYLEEEKFFLFSKNMVRGEGNRILLEGLISEGNLQAIL